ncbi:MAG: ATP-dependent helicase HrpB [Marinovum sp.]|nr:ATP-dependent helicase HrpB [Marinovum sp.]
MKQTKLPIDDALPALLSAVAAHGRAVLQAPPGAGKTTRVPLALREAGVIQGKIIMLEPRRLAARGAAARMAETLGEAIGETVGYRIRGDKKVSAKTQIEVVTEGILTHMLQSNPDLPGVGAVIFDEFHERSLNADFGLALCLEVAEALRDDLGLIVMSATLDAHPVAKLMGGAPLVTSEGRSYPVDLHFRDVPLGPKARLEPVMAETILTALKNHDGGLLAFLPGEPEIRRTAGLLDRKLPSDCVLHTLYGALPFKAQQVAVRPESKGRKVVLATAIAETSLTLPDIRIVVDGGRARRARYDPGAGLSRLVTEPASRAESSQRAGRAGRVAPGVAYRLWTKGEDGARTAFAPAEIEVADLAGLALDVAQWGAPVGSLPLLTAPPAGPWAEAQALLQILGATDDTGRITEHGARLARLPLHPRLGHMLTLAGPDASGLAALLSDRDILRGAPVDLILRLEALRDPKGFRARRPFEVHQAGLERVRQEARRLSSLTSPPKETLSLAQQAALAYPDRVALRRKGDMPRFLLSGGKGGVLPDVDPLAGARLLVVTDTDGHPREAKIRQAIALSERELRAIFGDQITWQTSCRWSKRDRRVVTRQEERFGAIALADRLWKDVPSDKIATAMLDGVRDLGLRHTAAAARFIARVNVGRRGGLDLPGMSETALLEQLEVWLLPYLDGVRSAEDWKNLDTLAALRARLDWSQMQALDAAVPGQFTTPLGRQIAIDYGGEQPEIHLRLQEMFGQTTHPSVAGQPLRVTLLSPAGRPVQTTMDLPGFWDTSYDDVRRDMRGRYPKHPWPENPREADPTLRAKPRKR